MTADQNERAGAPGAGRDGPIRYCIVSSRGRSGSSLLVNMLNRHRPERILCHGEVFRHEQLADGVRTPGFETVEARCERYGAFLESLENASAQSEPGLHAAGFKIFTPHCPPALEHLIGGGAYRVIFLRRANLLAQFSSFKIARLSGEWQKPKAAGLSGLKSVIKGAPKAEGQRQVPFWPKQFREFIDDISERDEMVRGMIASAGCPSVEVEYESLRTEATRRAIGGLLGVGTLDPEAEDLVKQNTSRVLDRFSNPEKAVAYLEESGQTHWLDEQPDQKPDPVGRGQRS